MKMRRSLSLASLALVLALFLGSLGPLPAQALDRTVNQRVMKSAVQIIAAEQDSGGQFSSKWSGSGTIISADGLILTNCHVANPRAMWDDPQFDYDVLIVALTGRSDEPPDPTFIAEVAQFDPGLDLAVIRITRYLDGRAVDPKKLNLPALAIADSDDLEIGDGLVIFGYPGIGGETITLTSGNVSGFSRERGIDGRAWIKTDATIAGGNSGGTGVNSDGNMVGVPTQGGSGSDGQIVDCRYIADTNGDGVVDDRDTCVPMGGFINALRPVNLAKPMIEAASRGLSPQPTPTPGPSQPQPSGKASVSRLIFAPAVNDGDQPTAVVDSFPSGTKEIYLFFDYQNFQDGTSWQPVMLYNGKTYTNVWPMANWSGGAQGSWWISVNNDPLRDGKYQFDLYYDSQKIGSASVQVGGTAQSRSTFSNITFSGGGEKGYILPGGITQVDASFSYANMTRQTKWSYTWYRDGRKLSSGDGPYLTSSSGSTSVTLSDRAGLAAGTYRLELSIAGKLAASADFLVGGKSSPGEDLLGPITFAEGVDRNDNPVRSGTTFKSGILELYAFFDYQGMQDDWSWVRRWYLDGEVVAETEDSWQGGESGNFWVKIYNNNKPLPNGKYQIELLVEGQLIRSGDCTIGTGTTSPTPTPKPAEGVEVYGQITDADTGDGISGAVFLVLKPGVTVSSFKWTEAEVYAIGEADRNGDYELSQPLVRGETYSMIVGAQGYERIEEDDISIPDNLESPYEISVTLQKAQ